MTRSVEENMTSSEVKKERSYRDLNTGFRKLFEGKGPCRQLQVSWPPSIISVITRVGQ